MEIVKSLQIQKLLKSFLVIFIGSIILTISAKVKIPFYPVPMTMQPFVVLFTPEIYRNWTCLRFLPRIISRTISRCCTVTGRKFDTGNIRLYPSSCNCVSEYHDVHLAIQPWTRPNFRHDHPLAAVRHCWLCWMDSLNLLVHCLYINQRKLCACPRPGGTTIYISSVCFNFSRNGQPQGNCWCHAACRRHRSTGSWKDLLKSAI